jgi:hypothetical protein
MRGLLSCVVQIHWLEAERAACQGIFRAAAGATLAGALPEPPGAPPTAAEQRFQQVIMPSLGPPSARDPASRRLVRALKGKLCVVINQRRSCVVTLPLLALALASDVQLACPATTDDGRTVPAHRPAAGVLTDTGCCVCAALEGLSVGVPARAACLPAVCGCHGHLWCDCSQMTLRGAACQAGSCPAEADFQEGVVQDWFGGSSCCRPGLQMSRQNTCLVWRMTVC